MENYHALLRQVRDHGHDRLDRTGIGTKSLFGAQLRFDLRGNQWPLLTTKKLHLKSIVHELLWFLRGDSNVASLRAAGVTIWDEWADERGDLGPIYGVQWRSWPAPDGHTIDQLAQVLAELRANPASRRLLVSAWNVASLPHMALPPCHVLFQLYVADGELSCQVYQRSADLFLGVPFNIASYALLTHLIAHQMDLTARELIWVGGDVHLYQNHQTQAATLLERTPFPPPTLALSRRPPTLFDYESTDIHAVDYQAHPSILAPVSI